jgi:hypothetical protein
MTRNMGRVAIYMVTMLSAVLLADAALAQDALIAGRRFYSASRNFGEDLGPAPIVRQQDIFGGQRFAVVGGGIADRRTGAIVPVSGLILAVDHARPRIFVRRATGVWSVDVQSGAEISMWQGDGTLVEHCALAYSANVLFCGVLRNDDLTDVVAIDVPTSHAATIAAIRIPPSASYDGWEAWIVTSDGRRLYFGQDMGPSDVRLSVLHTVTGAITTSTASGVHSPTALGGKVIVDETHERVIVIENPTVTVLSEDLAVLASGSVGGNCANLVISPHTGRLYLGEWDDYLGGGGPVRLRVLDAATYASLAPAVVPGYSKDNDCPYMAVLTAPGAPKDLTATVLGSEVTLTWTNVGGASGFVLDVGFAPGRSDLQVPLGPDARVTFPNVPSGTYFLRLRGGNESGGGHPSPEITFTVP